MTLTLTMTGGADVVSQSFLIMDGMPRRVELLAYEQGGGVMPKVVTVPVTVRASILSA